MIWVYRCLDPPDRCKSTSEVLHRRDFPQHRSSSGRVAGVRCHARGKLKDVYVYRLAQHAVENSRWHVIDADGQVLGPDRHRRCRLLQGKHKPIYTPFIDTGDHIVVVNAARVKLTGRKEDQKIYRQHSGYEGGLREERARVVRAKRPERLVEEAVRGMLPKTKMGEAMYRKLKVYAGPDHPHSAQKPTKLEVA